MHREHTDEFPEGACRFPELAGCNCRFSWGVFRVTVRHLIVRVQVSRSDVETMYEQEPADQRQITGVVIADDRQLPILIVATNCLDLHWGIFLNPVEQFRVLFNFLIRETFRI